MKIACFHLNLHRFPAGAPKFLPQFKDTKVRLIRDCKTAFRCKCEWLLVCVRPTID